MFYGRETLLTKEEEKFYNDILNKANELLPENIRVEESSFKKKTDNQFMFKLVRKNSTNTSISVRTIIISNGNGLLELEEVVNKLLNDISKG
jgi:hypothetical protein